MVSVTIQLPEGVLSAIRLDPDAFARELRVAAAVKWYELKRVSQGRAAEIAGLSRAEFITELGKHGVSPFQETAEDLAKLG